ncbi:hypothetical protein [Aminobacter sp. AP02]|uniref:hypothetical protein n=1 Tax=Aminobacter sp. AP02 TaxID=2135737 RepID=UPI000D6B380E|nr:hypothetical protein [Aminobacter sp. AP02]
MTGPEIMAVVGFFLTLAYAMWFAWGRVEGKVKIAEDKADKALGKIADHKLHVAETYVSKQGHREATDQVMEAIGAVKTAVEGTNLRIDRMWESHGKPAPRARQ